MDGPELGVYSVAVFTDIGVIKTKHDAPTDLRPGQDLVAVAIDKAIQYARGVLVSCQDRAVEKSLRFALGRGKGEHDDLRVRPG